MDVELRAHLTFHLRGWQAAAALDSLDIENARPALLARYVPLTDLRYDFPLVFFDDGQIQPLSGVIDRLLRDLAAGEDETRISHHVLRVERRMREIAARGEGGALLDAWDVAAAQLQVDRDPLLDDSLMRARAALPDDGRLSDCDAGLPRRLMRHLWQAAHDEKAARFHLEIDRLILNLSDILDADRAISAKGASVERLRASVGPVEQDTFDFDRLSSTLARTAPSTTLPDARRERIVRTLAVLRQQRFFSGVNAYPFVFTSCADALNAYWLRHAHMTELVRAIDVARLESDGRYQGSAHEGLFDAPGRRDLDASQLRLFPDYLVEIDADNLDAVEHTALMDALAAGVPIKVLVQTNDLLDVAPVGRAHFGFGRRGRQLVNTAIGLPNVFVLQAPASHLLDAADGVRAGLRYAGPAVFSVFSGASGHTGELPPYLIAAAALESRAFPAFVYDPSAGPDLATRFSVAGNPRAADDWPVYPFAHENADHQRVSIDLPFTFVDFVACDSRYASHFAPIERTAWHDRLITVSKALATDGNPDGDGVPWIAMVDRSHRFGRVLVEDVLIREARRCGELWHRLQELGGVHNSHARRQLERERAVQVDGSLAPVALDAVPRIDAPADTAVPTSIADRPPGAPYIETPRCSTCNECTQINNKMFGYNENKQAYIADAAAGTYRQLVEAAESCQVSIIHPGLPRNANEPGLEELIARAEAFQ